MMAVDYIEKVLQDWMYEAEGVVIEGDNASVMDYLQKLKQQERWRLRAEDGDRLDWMKQFCKMLFVHTYLHQNKAAQFCAQRAIEDNFVWDIGDTLSTCNP